MSSSWAFVLLLTAVTLVACGGPPIPYDVPAIAPIVAEATPAALRPGPVASALLAAGPEDPAEPTHLVAVAYLRHLFQDRYQGNDGRSFAGWINARLSIVDERLDEINARAREFRRVCLERPTAIHHFDATAIASALSLDLDLQCSELFEPAPDEQTRTGSGLALGKLGARYSVWEYLIGGAVIAFVANVSDPDTQQETVDAIFLETVSDLAPELAGVSAARLKVRRFQRTFELALASTGDNVATGTVPPPGEYEGYAGLGPGFQMVSDGQRIFAGGRLRRASDSPLEWFEICLDAADLAARATTDCGDLRSSNTLGVDLTQEALRGQADLVRAIAPIANVRGRTADFNEGSER